jgi:hypothetical protein
LLLAVSPPPSYPRRQLLEYGEAAPLREALEARERRELAKHAFSNPLLQ